MFQAILPFFHYTIGKLERIPYKQRHIAVVSDDFGPISTTQKLLDKMGYGHKDIGKYWVLEGFLTLTRDLNLKQTFGKSKCWTFNPKKIDFFVIFTFFIFPFFPERHVFPYALESGAIPPKLS